MTCNSYESKKVRLRAVFLFPRISPIPKLHADGLNNKKVGCLSRRVTGVVGTGDLGLGICLPFEASATAPLQNQRKINYL